MYMSEEIVRFNAAVSNELRHVEVGERGEGILNRVPQGVEKVEELRREDVLEDREKTEKRPNL